MKSNLKRLFLWSSLGSLVVGAAVAASRRPRKLAPLSFEIVPSGCQRIVLRTESFEVGKDTYKLQAYDQYLLQLTAFKVWNVLEVQPLQRAFAGEPIYHVTRVRYAEAAEGAPSPERPDATERFYGTMRVLDPAADSEARNSLARGGFLEIRKCHVGGASNGIETGEVHRSAERILHYRFEY